MSVVDHDLHAGVRADAAGHDLVAGDADDPARQLDRARADDPQRARRHEVRRVVSGAVPRELRRARRERAGACCARSSPAAGSASRRGSAASRCTRCSPRPFRPGRESPGGVWIAFGLFWLVQVAIIVRGLEGIKKLESWSAPLLLGGGALLLALGDPARRRSRAHPRRVVATADRARAVLAAVSGRAHRERRLLGDAQPEHSRLHALRAQPAIAGARAGARAAGDDDRVRVHRRRGHQRDDRDLRRGDLGSGGAHRADRQPAGHRVRRARRPPRPADDQHGGQRRVAGERLLEPRAAPHQLRHRRPDHGGASAS